MKLKVLLLLVMAWTLGMTAPVQAADPQEPEIVIRKEGKKTFYEYRVNGVLREIKVVPEVGPEYYLVPADGGGWIREDQSQLLVPSWVIFKW